MAFAGSDEAGGFYQPADYVHLIQSSLCCADHVVSQLIFGLMDTWRVHEYDLSLIRGQHGPDPVSGGLGLIGCNRYFLSD